MTPEKAKNIYWGVSPLPSGAKSLGEYVDDNRRGCLIELSSGIKVCGNAGIITTIPQGRGGKRTGAGRKPDPETVKVISKAITLPPELWEWIDKQDGSRGRVIGKIIQKEIHREIN
jgi:hypothetical protein